MQSFICVSCQIIKQLSLILFASIHFWYNTSETRKLYLQTLACLNRACPDGYNIITRSFSSRPQPPSNLNVALTNDSVSNKEKNMNILNFLKDIFPFYLFTF